MDSDTMNIGGAGFYFTAYRPLLQTESTNKNDLNLNLNLDPNTQLAKKTKIFILREH